MKRKKVQARKESAGTVLAAQMRAEGNKLTDADREQLGDEFLRLYYGAKRDPAATRRR